jgi:hypothetical protein
MPRNTTGGSGHKGERNSKSHKEIKNQEIGDLLLDDYNNSEGVYVGLVTKRLGNGRMEVSYRKKVQGDLNIYTMNIPLRGGMKGKGKKDVWVDVNSYVVFAETELSGKTHEIISVLTPDQIVKYQTIVPQHIRRENEEVLFEEQDEIDVEAI